MPEELWTEVHNIVQEVETKTIPKQKKWKKPKRLSEVQFAQLCPTRCDPMDYTAHGVLQARILERVASSFLQWIFPTQGLNPGFLHCGQVLYQLSHQGSPRILEWVAYPFSSESSWCRNQTEVSGIAGRFFTSWAIMEAQGAFTNNWGKKRS